MDEFFFDESNENFRPPHVMVSFTEMANKHKKINDAGVNVLSDTTLMNSVFDDHVLPSDGMVSAGASSSTSSSSSALQSSGMFFTDKTDQLSQILSGMNIKNGISVPAASAAVSSQRLDQAVAMTIGPDVVEEEQDDSADGRFGFDFTCEPVLTENDGDIFLTRSPTYH